MSGATITLPGPILDMLAKGVREMPNPNGYVVEAALGGIHHVFLVTDAGDGLLFVRAPDMVRT